MGIVMTTPVKQVNYLQAIPYSFRAVYEYGKLLIQIPVLLIRGQIDPEQARIVGPKGIYDMFSQARQMDQQTSSGDTSTPAINTLWLLAIFSVSIGIANLLPIPAMDGGRILFIIPELLFRKRIPPKFESMIHGVSFLILLALLGYFYILDFINPVSIILP